jgi:holliday junction DNA helicase RuvA
MIGYISGKILDISTHHILILPSSGVGYEILISELTYAELVSVQQVEMYIYHHVTENSQALFGFLTLEEKKIFIELIKISGVGGKVALLLLSLGVEKLITSVQLADHKTIESVK